MLPEPATLPETSLSDESWRSVSRQARDLAAALRSLAAEHAPPILSACVAYANLVDEIVRLAEARGKVPGAPRGSPALTPKQLQDFGRLLRDKRNQAGLSRVQLARLAKISDATVKFIETARHPPSRVTLLRLVGVAKLGLRWSDTPGYGSEPPPAGWEGAGVAPLAAELHRFDARLSIPTVMEALLVLDELRAGQSQVEISAYGIRRACCLCGSRSDAWAVDAREAAKLPIRHAAPCPGRLADALCQRHPVLAELAHQARRDLHNPTATQIEASRRATQIERFHGCRSAREIAALLARVAALPHTPYRQGVSAVLLWALGLGQCPVEPTHEAFSERRTQQLAALEPKRSSPAARDAAQLRGVSSAAAWLVSPTAPLPSELLPDSPEPDSCPPAADPSDHVPA